MAVTALMCLSLLPVSATVTAEPPAPRSVRIDVRGLFGSAPSAVVGAFAVGLINGPVIAIAPVYGTGIGLTQDQAAALLFALQGGSLALQWPLGWLSDRADRRLVIAGARGGHGARLARHPGRALGRRVPRDRRLRAVGRARPLHLFGLRRPCVRPRRA